MKNSSGIKASIIILIGTLVRFFYVLNTSVYERTHDAGNYTVLTDGIVNPGHLGYIEYFAKFRHMPDFDPFSVFSYFHPPVHHYLASLVVRFSVFCGASIDTAFENVQFLTLFYSVVSMILVYFILLELFSHFPGELKKGRDLAIFLPLSLYCFHPGTVYMAATVNNDMMTVMAEFLIILTALKWIRTKSSPMLFLLAFLLGMGMLIKISVCLFAFPIGIVMLLQLGDSLRDKKASGVSFASLMRRFLLFAVIAGSLGLSFTVRNFIRFRQKPGIASATPESHLYMGNHSLWERLGIPKSLGLSYPFHSVYGKDSTNVWVILFKTSLFSEIRPDVEGIALFLCQTALILAIVLGLACTFLAFRTDIRLIRNRCRDTGIFLFAGFFIFIAAYIAFVIKYPYTCSCDFRYMVAALLFGCLGLSQEIAHVEKRKNS